MAEYIEVMKQQKRMCRYYDKKTGSCNECPLDKEEMDYVCEEAPCVIELDDMKKIERLVMDWATEHPEPVYPTWREVIEHITGILMIDIIDDPIPDDIAQKLGIEPKHE